MTPSPRPTKRIAFRPTRADVPAIERLVAIYGTPSAAVRKAIHTLDTATRPEANGTGREKSLTRSGSDNGERIAASG
jgi:hypothetical protein